MAQDPNVPTEAVQETSQKRGSERERDHGQEAGYQDAEPVSPDENPGDADKDLNKEAAEAYAKAGDSSQEQHESD